MKIKTSKLSADIRRLSGSKQKLGSSKNKPFATSMFEMMCDDDFLTTDVKQIKFKILNEIK